MIGLHQAAAQLAGGAAPHAVPGLPGVEVSATPYLWLPWTSVDVNPSNARLSSASSTIGSGTLISHLTWVPFMGAAEFRSGQFGVLFDYLHAPVKSGISTRNILFTGANAGLTIDSGSTMIMYRPVTMPDQYLVVGVGFRAWGVDGETALSQRFTALPPVNISHGGAWADPLIAIRYHHALGNGFSATGYADVGGFGAGADVDVDWQLIGTIDYARNPGLDLHAGFRGLNFNYGAPRAGFDVHMYGPIISASFRS